MLEINGTIVAVIINFAVLVWILNSFLYKPVRNILLERKNRIESDTDEARKKLKDAEDIKASYEIKLKQSGDEAKKIIDAANNTAESLKTAAQKDASENAEKSRKDAEAEAEKIKTEAFDSVRSQISSMVVMAAGKVIEKNIDAASQSALIDEFIGKIEKAGLN
ncbi:MAG: F0F1 ATP synthase subunit B [Candidatus Saganbacteria bacterium]|nr:F0F1 ATP synthase subunit B [Candidatus Saganbacteria bacterium]